MRMSILLAGASFAVLAATSAAAQEAGDVAEVVVTAAPYAISEDSATTSVAIVDRDALDEAPAGGLGGLLGGMPGLRSTSFGPGASRPVVRGLAGPRVSVLTNGVGMIDASALSPDHQVASDPGEASRVEVLRGPAALLYGGSAIGGVVNIFDDRIARSLPDRPVSGRFNASVSSVDDGRSVSGALRLTSGPLVFSFDVLSRESDDYRIPAYPESRQLLDAEGEDPEKPFPERLENSAVRLDTFGAGVSFVGDEGYFGVAVKTVDTLYGVPGHAHEEPAVPPPVPEPEEHVTIGLKQTRLDVRGERNAALGPFQTLRFTGGYADYTHTEFEGAETGTVFTSDGIEGRLELVQAERGGWNGAVGVQALRRDFDAEGDEAYVPRTRIEEFGVFTLQRVDNGGWGYEGGLRFDRRSLDSVAGQREFDNVSASAGLFFRPTDAWFLGLSVSRTGRAPTEAELFADGPHVATRGYEIGDADLEKEVATSLELTAHYGSERLDADLHVYGVRYDGFIDLTPTGAVIDDLDVFQYVQTDATFYGFEAEAAWTAWRDGDRKLKLEAGADYVRADTDLGAPARIPPWSLTGRLVWEDSQWTARLEVRHVAEQDRIATYELPTDSYTQVNLGGSWSPPALKGVKLYAEIRNLTDTEIREHASFLKDLAPQPGRNFRAGIAWRF
ncbi:MAG TPA: TonB-dependent receptor [Caulobacter sp.]|nr:TonB-dependent receptor [Caulobacter sp.]